MDMTTEHTDENPVVTQASFEDLQKRLAKAEGKLAKAKTRAQATMQEIWQMDVKLKEEEDRANKAEALLEQASSANSSAPIQSGLEHARTRGESCQTRRAVGRGLEGTRAKAGPRIGAGSA